MSQSQPKEPVDGLRPLSQERPSLRSDRPVRRSAIAAWSAVSAVVIGCALSTELKPQDMLTAWIVTSGLILFVGMALRVRDLERFISRRQEDQETHNARLQEAALTDPMTGLPNRRHLMERLDQEVARSKRSGESLACLFLDVDGFAEVNNKYLHEAGDSILATLAGVLRRQLRTADILGRYGGDEFVILLPEVRADQVGPIADRLRRAVERHRFRALPPHEAVTVSIGASLCALDGGTEPSDLLRTADESLYRAKEGGRNQVALHESLAGRSASGSVHDDDFGSRNEPVRSARAPSRRVAGE